MVDFEEDGNQEIMLLDSSFRHDGSASLTDILYDSSEVFSKINIENIEEDSRILQCISNLANEGKLRVTHEVIKENEEFLRILNLQRSFLKKHMDRKRFNRTMRQRDQLIERSEKNRYIESIRAYTNKIFKTINVIKGLDPRDYFSKTELQIYRSFLDIIRDFSRQADRWDMEEKIQQYKNPTLTGYQLETKGKILACAFTLSYEQPVKILTRSKNIKIVLDKVNLRMPESNFRFYNGLPNLERYPILTQSEHNELN